MHRLNSSTTSEDHHLIRAAQKEPEAFGVLYEKYYVRIFRFIVDKVGNKAIAADLCSMCFTKAMLHIGKYKDRGVPFVYWLLRIATNEVHMYFRNSKKNIHIEIDDKQLRNLSETTEVANDDVSRGRMIQALNTLSDKEAQLIEHRFFDELSFKEIAHIYRVSEATVKMRVYRILERLRKRIQQTDGNR